MSNSSHHAVHSSFRENLIEHLFIAELLKESWLRKECTLEVAKPEVDNAGYDLIAESPSCVRHIQLKTTKIGGKTPAQKVHTKLAEKSSGCVVWIFFDEKEWALGPFRFFGSAAGKSLPSLNEFKIAKHTKGNKDGDKTKRPNIRVIPKSNFDYFESFKDLFDQLFKL